MARKKIVVSEKSDKKNIVVPNPKPIPTPVVAPKPIPTPVVAPKPIPTPIVAPKPVSDKRQSSVDNSKQGKSDKRNK